MPLVEQPLIPDEVLKKAYLTVSRRVRKYREKFVADTRNIEAVIVELGSDYKGVAPEVGTLGDWLRARIPDRCKNPNLEGWAATKSGHGASKGHKETDRKRVISKELQDHYDSAFYASLKDEVMYFYERRCVGCSGEAIELHHHRYDRIGTNDEIKDVVPVCRKCHNVLDSRRERENDANSE